MLRFERRVVAALTGATEPRRREDVEEFVGGTLAAMPEHLRAGVLAASVGLGTVARVGDVLARPARGDGGDPVVERMARTSLGPVQQYFRLFRSLVVFAEHETAAEPST